VAAAAALVVLAACSDGQYPNSTFLPTTENNRDVTALWNTMMFWGTIVFVIVEAILLFTIIKYRRRPGGPEPRHVHGNTLMEITWTLAPALILVFIAVPTVRTIFRNQAPAPANALQVEVIGHQWWWEFRYPEYGVTTANELYLPHGRPVNFALRTADVLHSFWIPALAGKRDLISNRTNYLWFTPDSTGEAAFNGSCNEYCGASHANMKFRVFTVAEGDFATWARHNAANAVYPPPAAPAADSAAPLVRPASNPAQGGEATTPAATQAAAQAAAQTAAQGAPGQPAAPTTPWAFPREKIPPHVVPQTPIPAGLTIADNVIAAGDAQRGFTTYSRSACIGCHKIRGNPSSMGILGPDLTHVGSRYTIAGGLFPNDAKHLAHWIKNARAMKPGSLMQTLGKGERDPIMGITVEAGGLTDEQIADITAYLLSLK
jgi:cytochrome c oxidase subunit II